MVNNPLIANARYKNETWPVRISNISEIEYEIYGHGTSYQVFIFPRACGVLVAITNWNRCGYIPYRDIIHPEDVADYLDMGGSIDTRTISAGLSEIMRNYILLSPVVENYNRQRRTLIEKIQCAQV